MEAHGDSYYRVLSGTGKFSLPIVKILISLSSTFLLGNAIKQVNKQEARSAVLTSVPDEDKRLSACNL